MSARTVRCRRAQLGPALGTNLGWHRDCDIGGCPITLYVPFYGPGTLELLGARFASFEQILPNSGAGDIPSFFDTAAEAGAQHHDRPLAEPATPIPGCEPLTARRRNLR